MVRSRGQSRPEPQEKTEPPTKSLPWAVLSRHRPGTAYGNVRGRLLVEPTSSTRDPLRDDPGARAKRSQSSPHPVRPTVVACAGQTGFTECFRMMGGSADSPFGMVPPAPTAVSAARVHPWALPMTKPPTVSGPWTVPFGPP